MDSPALKKVFCLGIWVVPSTPQREYGHPTVF
jgi:hypothetical protein